MLVLLVRVQPLDDNLGRSAYTGNLVGRESA